MIAMPPPHFPSLYFPHFWKHPARDSGTHILNSGKPNQCFGNFAYSDSMNETKKKPRNSMYSAVQKVGLGTAYF